MFRGVRFLLNYMLSVFKISCLLSCALFMPRLFLHYVAKSEQSSLSIRQEASDFKLGLENISSDFLLSLGSKGDLSYRVALLTNHTGKDQEGRRNIDILLKKGVNLTAIISPKHGFNANMAENHVITPCVDPATKIPLVSWGANEQAKSELFKNIEVIMFDLQDSGMRHGYVTTLLDVMKTAAAYNKKMVILDRPNLLGSYMEGSLAAFEVQNSTPFIPVPMRHGMTVAELATFFNKNLLEKPVALHVVPMENYTRHAHVPTTLACHLSPNITSINSCYGYSFLGLLGEIGPFDIGVGTDKAFQCLLLPDYINISKQQWYALKEILKKHGVDSKVYRCFNERKQQNYTGLKLHIRDINNFSSFNTLLSVLNFFKDAGVTLTFSHRFDSTIGTSKVRECIQGSVELQELELLLNKDLALFFNKAMSSFIYKPLPQVVRV